MSFRPNTCKPCRLHDRDQVLASASWEAVPESLRRSRGARPGPSALSNQSEGYKNLRCPASNMCFTASSRRRLTFRSFCNKLMVFDFLAIHLVLSSSSKAFSVPDLNQRNLKKYMHGQLKHIYIYISSIITPMKSCHHPIKGAVRGQRKAKMWKSWQSWWAIVS